MTRRKEHKGKSVRRSVQSYYEHHKHKKPASYIAGAVACRIREQHGRTCSPRAHRKRKLARW